VKACPAGARELNGQEKTAAGLVEEVMADRIFFEESDGGITFSGGEPLFQYDFLRSVLESCRSAGLHTAVDTCGHAPGQHLIALAQVTDLFLYDLKFMDDSRHREYTGVSNRLILENLRALAASHSPIWLRVPVIPGINDTPEETDAMALFARSLPAIQMVCLLPYHRAGIGKFRQLKRDYRLPEVVPPEQAHMESIGERFRRLGLRVKIGG
jgi:pyruvate formate lyase activating enzyme